ncbi:NAD(P)-binding protein [Schizophyllum commune Tattone D]|nr:NAD(P)-binding protein [Schizophyllum commune Tattone D]
MACFDSSRLHNKTAIVTGASAGIGAEAGGNFATVKLDLSDRDQIARFWEKVPERLREVDILVNNAGFVLGWEHVGDIADEDVEKMLSINVFGLIAMTQLLIKGMGIHWVEGRRDRSDEALADFKARNLGHIINIGSIGSREPYADGAIYTATKHAVKAFTGSLLRELVNTRIRVSEVQPGLVDTELALIRFRGDKDAIAKLYDGLEPLTGQDVAEDIVWVASRPPHVNVAEVFVLPTYQASVTIKRRPGDQI